MDDILHNMADKIASRDQERRRIGFASMRAKLASAKIVLEAAEKLANEAENTFVCQCSAATNGHDTSHIQAQCYCESEAIYAAAEEVIKTLDLVQILCAKLSGAKTVAPLDRFTKAVESGGPPPRQ